MAQAVINESRTATNYTPGPAAGRGNPTEIVIHHWGVDGQTHDGVVNWFCTPGNGCGTSAHFVASAGRVHCIVSTEDVAWHAGDWAVNLRSIGIECRPEATDADYATVAELIRTLRGMYGDLPLRPHSNQRQGTDGGYGSALTDCPGRYDLTRLDKLARGITVTPQGNKPETITPTQGGFLMALTDKQQQEIYDRITRYTDAPIGSVPEKTVAAILDAPISRAKVGGKTSLRSTIAYLDSNLNGIIAASDPKAIADAIPADLAQQVINALSAKLGAK